MSSEQDVNLSAAERRGKEAEERARRALQDDADRHRDQQEQRRRATQGLRARRIPAADLLRGKE